MAYHIINVDILVEKTGQDGPVLRVLLAILIAYPLAFLYGITLYKKNPIIQHVFLTVCGLFLAVFLYGLEGLHTLVAVTVQYLIIHIIGPNYIMVVLSFIFQMTYLIVGYIKYSTDSYDIAWTTAQCIVVLRLIGVAWDTYDGAQNLEKASNDTKLLALKNPPGFLEMTGHVYYFGSFVVGPQNVVILSHFVMSSVFKIESLTLFPMHRYRSFVDGTLIPKEHDLQSIKFSIAFNKMFISVPEYARKTITWSLSNEIKKGLLRFASGVVYLTVYGLFQPTFNNDYLVSKGFDALPLLKKLGYVTVWGKIALCKYLGVWLIAEGSCIMSGLTYNGKTDSGNVRWDALKNCKITVYETATTLQGLIDSFNVNTNMWMSRYLFKRLRFLGNKTLSHVTTLFFLAIWHGIYIGYFVCFISEYLYITAERQILSVCKLVAERLEFKDSGILWVLKTCFAFFFKTVLMSYCLLPFCLLTWSRIYKVYYSTYALPHVLLITWFLFYIFVYPSLVKKESGEAKDKAE